jgi:hypothetical protein
VTVSFRLDKCQPEDGQSVAKYLASVLREAITKESDKSKLDWAKKALAIKWSKVPHNAVAVVKAFQTSTGRGIFLHFDEARGEEPLPRR